MKSDLVNELKKMGWAEDLINAAQAISKSIEDAAVTEKISGNIQGLEFQNIDSTSVQLDTHLNDESSTLLIPIHHSSK